MWVSKMQKKVVASTVIFFSCVAIQLLEFKFNFVHLQLLCSNGKKRKRKKSLFKNIAVFLINFCVIYFTAAQSMQ